MAKRRRRELPRTREEAGEKADARSFVAHEDATALTRTAASRWADGELLSLRQQLDPVTFEAQSERDQRLMAKGLTDPDKGLAPLKEAMLRDALEDGFIDREGIEHQIRRQQDVDAAVRARLIQDVDRALDELVEQGLVTRDEHGDYGYVPTGGLEEVRTVVSTDHGDDAVGMILAPEDDVILGTLPGTPAREFTDARGYAALSELTGLPLSNEVSQAEEVVTPISERSILLDSRVRACAMVFARWVDRRGGPEEMERRVRADLEAIEPGLTTWFESRIDQNKAITGDQP